MLDGLAENALTGYLGVSASHALYQGLEHRPTITVIHEEIGQECPHELRVGDVFDEDGEICSSKCSTLHRAL